MRTRAGRHGGAAAGDAGAGLGGRGASLRRRHRPPPGLEGGPSWGGQVHQARLGGPPSSSASTWSVAARRSPAWRRARARRRSSQAFEWGSKGRAGPRARRTGAATVFGLVGRGRHRLPGPAQVQGGFDRARRVVQCRLHRLQIAAAAAQQQDRLDGAELPQQLVAVALQPFQCGRGGRTARGSTRARLLACTQCRQRVIGFAPRHRRQVSSGWPVTSARVARASDCWAWRAMARHTRRTVPAI